MKILKGICIAFSIYSKIPMPQFAWEEEDMEYMMCFFPWIGAVIGVVFVLWHALCERCGIGTLCGSFIAAAIPLAISGGFHVDGYMDTMDAFHSYQSKEKKLEILKDSHIGAFAVIMVILYYLIDIAALSEIKTMQAAILVGTGFPMARCFSGLGVMWLAPAREEGMLHTFAKDARKKIVAGVLLVQLVLLCGLDLWLSVTGGLAVIVTVLVCFLYFRWKSYRELGGITGDTAGFFVTVCEAAIAAAVAIIM